MAHNVNDCPKCGYRREQTNEVNSACPSCGIIYEKYLKRLSTLEEKTAGSPSPAPPTSVTSSKLRFSPTMMVIAIIALVVAGFAFRNVRGGKQQPNVPGSDATEKIIRTFPYDIKGAYTAHFTREWIDKEKSQNNYTMEYFATLTVDNQYLVSELSWTDTTGLMAKGTVNWSFPDTQEVIGELRRDGKKEEPFIRVTAIARTGRALSLDIDEPKSGRMVVDWKDGLKTPLPGTEKNGLFEYVKEQELLRAKVKVIISPSIDLDVPQSALTAFNAGSRWAEWCVDPLYRAGGQTVFEDMDCRDITVFTGSHQVITLKLKHVDVPSVASLQLKKDSKVLLHVGFERNAEVLFFRDGRKKLLILDLMMDGKPLEFDLEHR